MTTQNTIPILLDSKPKGVVLSPSQIGTYDLCKRRWAFEYIAGIRSAPHPSAQLGTEVHSLLENWLRNAVPPPTDTKQGQIATRMIKHLPPPGTGVVERRFWFQTAHGNLYTGFIDWSGIMEMPTVIDHKTSSNVAMWGKTAADLHNDVQAVIYSVAGMLGFQTDTLDLFWNYGETKGKYNATPIKTRVSLPVVSEKFSSVIEPVATEITAHRIASNDPMSFPPTPASCGAYGGCPHQQRCNLTDAEKLGGIMNQQGPSMAERMAQATQQGGNGAAATPPQQPQLPGVQGAPQNTVGGPQVPPMPMQPPPVAPPTVEGAPPAQPYAPDVAPNPPEQGTAVTPPPKEDKPAQSKGRGRPAGSRNKTLSVEEQVFMAGVQAAISNPAWTGNDDTASHGGEVALRVFIEKFRA
jgi:hypothetical protein